MDSLIKFIDSLIDPEQKTSVLMNDASMGLIDSFTDALKID